MSVANKPWITVIGIGEDGLSGLSPVALKKLENAEIIVGGERHLQMLRAGGQMLRAGGQMLRAGGQTLPPGGQTLSPGEQTRMDWSAGFGKTLDIIEQKRGSHIVVLASGDPMYFGIGATMARRFGGRALNVIPAVGAVSLAASAMGWSLPDVSVTTIHGRPAQNIIYHLAAKAKIIALSNGAESPAEVASILSEHGFGPSKITVLENLGGKNENRIDGLADGMADGWGVDKSDGGEFSPLNTLAIECIAGPGVQGLSHLAGLVDDAYEHDGQITKREVRAITLAKLAPVSNEMLWDIGSGSGSISIEWMRAGKNLRAIAFEKDAVRAKNINTNAFNLGVTRLKVVEGSVPDVLTEINDAALPDAIFIGGGLSKNSNIINVAWDALKPGGRIVANAVTIKSEAVLFNFADEVAGELSRINIERQEKIGGQVSFRPLKAVTQLVAYKPEKNK